MLGLPIENELHVGNSNREIFMSTAFLFPGQGAQQVAMGKDFYDAFPAARVVFDQAEELTHLPLKRLCFEGPIEDLSRTDVAQPAIFTVSAALLACMSSLLGPEQVDKIRPAFMAGLSLGEYTALFASGMLSFTDAIRLVTRRGAAMQRAAQATPSAMVCVMGLDEQQAGALCEHSADGEILTCANFNCPGQIVLSGQIQACKRAKESAGEFGASGAVELQVAGAFHSPIMAPARAELAGALNEVKFSKPAEAKIAGRHEMPNPDWAQEFASQSLKVIANVDAGPYDESPAGEKLLAQLTGAVRWQQSMEYLLGAGVTRFYEIGPGRVLSGLMRRIDRKAEVVAINSCQSLEKLAESF